MSSQNNPSDIVGKVSSVEGNVILTRVDGSQVNLKPGMLVLSTDSINTTHGDFELSTSAELLSSAALDQLYQELNSDDDTWAKFEAIAEKIDVALLEEETSEADESVEEEAPLDDTESSSEALISQFEPTAAGVSSEAAVAQVISLTGTVEIIDTRTGESSKVQVGDFIYQYHRIDARNGSIEVKQNASITSLMDITKQYPQDLTEVNPQQLQRLEALRNNQINSQEEVLTIAKQFGDIFSLIEEVHFAPPVVNNPDDAVRTSSTTPNVTLQVIQDNEADDLIQKELLPTQVQLSPIGFQVAQSFSINETSLSTLPDATQSRVIQQQLPTLSSENQMASVDISPINDVLANGSPDLLVAVTVDNPLGLQLTSNANVSETAFVTQLNGAVPNEASLVVQTISGSGASQTTYYWTNSDLKALQTQLGQDLATAQSLNTAAMTQQQSLTMVSDGLSLSGVSVSDSLLGLQAISSDLQSAINQNNQQLSDLNTTLNTARQSLANFESTRDSSTGLINAQLINNLLDTWNDLGGTAGTEPSGLASLLAQRDVFTQAIQSLEGMISSLSAVVQYQSLLQTEIDAELLTLGATPSSADTLETLSELLELTTDTVSESQKVIDGITSVNSDLLQIAPAQGQSSAFTFEVDLVRPVDLNDFNALKAQYSQNPVPVGTMPVTVTLLDGESQTVLVNATADGIVTDEQGLLPDNASLEADFELGIDNQGNPISELTLEIDIEPADPDTSETSGVPTPSSLLLTIDLPIPSQGTIVAAPAGWSLVGSTLQKLVTTSGPIQEALTIGFDPVALRGTDLTQITSIPLTVNVVEAALDSATNPDENLSDNQLVQQFNFLGDSGSTNPADARPLVTQNLSVIQREVPNFDLNNQSNLTLPFDLALVQQSVQPSNTFTAGTQLGFMQISVKDYLDDLSALRTTTGGAAGDTAVRDSALTFTITAQNLTDIEVGAVDQTTIYEFTQTPNTGEFTITGQALLDYLTAYETAVTNNDVDLITLLSQPGVVYNNYDGLDYTLDVTGTVGIAISNIISGLGVSVDAVAQGVNSLTVSDPQVTEFNNGQYSFGIQFSGSLIDTDDSESYQIEVSLNNFFTFSADLPQSLDTTIQLANGNQAPATIETRNNGNDTVLVINPTVTNGLYDETVTLAIDQSLLRYITNAQLPINQTTVTVQTEEVIPNGDTDFDLTNNTSTNILNQSFNPVEIDAGAVILQEFQTGDTATDGVNAVSVDLTPVFTDIQQNGANFPTAQVLTRSLGVTSANGVVLLDDTTQPTLESLFTQWDAASGNQAAQDALATILFTPPDFVGAEIDVEFLYDLGAGQVSFSGPINLLVDSVSSDVVNTTDVTANTTGSFGSAITLGALTSTVTFDITTALLDTDGSESIVIRVTLPETTGRLQAGSSITSFNFTESANSGITGGTVTNNVYEVEISATDIPTVFQNGTASLALDFSTSTLNALNIETVNPTPLLTDGMLPFNFEIETKEDPSANPDANLDVSNDQAVQFTNQVVVDASNIVNINVVNELSQPVDSDIVLADIANNNEAQVIPLTDAFNEITALLNSNSNALADFTVTIELGLAAGGTIPSNSGPVVFYNDTGTTFQTLSTSGTSITLDNATLTTLYNRFIDTQDINHNPNPNLFISSLAFSGADLVTDVRLEANGTDITTITNGQVVVDAVAQGVDTSSGQPTVSVISRYSDDNESVILEFVLDVSMIDFSGQEDVILTVDVSNIFNTTNGLSPTIVTAQNAVVQWQPVFDGGMLQPGQYELRLPQNTLQDITQSLTLSIDKDQFTTDDGTPTDFSDLFDSFGLDSDSLPVDLTITSRVNVSQITDQEPDLNNNEVSTLFTGLLDATFNTAVVTETPILGANNVVTQNNQVTVDINEAVNALVSQFFDSSGTILSSIEGVGETASEVQSALLATGQIEILVEGFNDPSVTTVNPLNLLFDETNNYTGLVGQPSFDTPTVTNNVISYTISGQDLFTLLNAAANGTPSNTDGLVTLDVNNTVDRDFSIRVQTTVPSDNGDTTQQIGSATFVVVDAVAQGLAQDTNGDDEISVDFEIISNAQTNRTEFNLDLSARMQDFDGSESHRIRITLSYDSTVETNLLPTFNFKTLNTDGNGALDFSLDRSVVGNLAFITLTADVIGNTTEEITDSLVLESDITQLTESLFNISTEVITVETPTDLEVDPLRLDTDTQLTDFDQGQSIDFDTLANNSTSNNVLVQSNNTVNAFTPTEVDTQESTVSQNMQQFVIHTVTTEPFNDAVLLSQFKDAFLEALVSFTDADGGQVAVTSPVTLTFDLSSQVATNGDPSSLTLGFVFPDSVDLGEDVNGSPLIDLNSLDGNQVLRLDDSPSATLSHIDYDDTTDTLSVILTPEVFNFFRDTYTAQTAEDASTDLSVLESIFFPVVVYEGDEIANAQPTDPDFSRQSISFVSFDSNNVNSISGIDLTQALTALEAEFVSQSGLDQSGLSNSRITIEFTGQFDPNEPPTAFIPFEIERRPGSDGFIEMNQVVESGRIVYELTGDDLVDFFETWQLEQSAQNPQPLESVAIFGSRYNDEDYAIDATVTIANAQGSGNQIQLFVDSIRSEVEALVQPIVIDPTIANLNQINSPPGFSTQESITFVTNTDDELTNFADLTLTVVGDPALALLDPSESHQLIIEISPQLLEDNLLINPDGDFPTTQSLESLLDAAGISIASLFTIQGSSSPWQQSNQSEVTSEFTLDLSPSGQIEPLVLRFNLDVLAELQLLLNTELNPFDGLDGFNFDINYQFISDDTNILDDNGALVSENIATSSINIQNDLRLKSVKRSNGNEDYNTFNNGILSTPPFFAGNTLTSDSLPPAFIVSLVALYNALNAISNQPAAIQDSELTINYSGLVEPTILLATASGGDLSTTGNNPFFVSDGSGEITVSGANLLSWLNSINQLATTNDVATEAETNPGLANLLNLIVGSGPDNDANFIIDIEFTPGAGAVDTLGSDPISILETTYVIVNPVISAKGVDVTLDSDTVSFNDGTFTNFPSYFPTSVQGDLNTLSSDEFFPFDPNAVEFDINVLSSARASTRIQINVDFEVQSTAQYQSHLVKLFLPNNGLEWDLKPGESGGWELSYDGQTDEFVLAKVFTPTQNNLTIETVTGFVGLTYNLAEATQQFNNGMRSSVLPVRVETASLDQSVDFNQLDQVLTTSSETFFINGLTDSSVDYNLLDPDLLIDDNNIISSVTNSYAFGMTGDNGNYENEARGGAFNPLSFGNFVANVSTADALNTTETRQTSFANLGEATQSSATINTETVNQTDFSVQDDNLDGARTILNTVSTGINAGNIIVSEGTNGATYQYIIGNFQDNGNSPLSVTIPNGSSQATIGSLLTGSITFDNGFDASALKDAYNALIQAIEFWTDTDTNAGGDQPLSASEILFASELEFQGTSGTTTLSVTNVLPGVQTVLDLLFSLHVLESLGLFSTDQSSGTTTQISDLIALFVSHAYQFDTATTPAVSQTGWVDDWDAIQGSTNTSLTVLSATESLIDSQALAVYLNEVTQIQPAAVDTYTSVNQSIYDLAVEKVNQLYNPLLTPGGQPIYDDNGQVILQPINPVTIDDDGGPLFLSLFQNLSPENPIQFGSKDVVLSLVSATGSGLPTTHADAEIATGNNVYTGGYGTDFLQGGQDSDVIYSNGLDTTVSGFSQLILPDLLQTDFVVSDDNLDGTRTIIGDVTTATTVAGIEPDLVGRLQAFESGTGAEYQYYIGGFFDQNNNLLQTDIPQFSNQTTVSLNVEDNTGALVSDQNVLTGNITIDETLDFSTLKDAYNALLLALEFWTDTDASTTGDQPLAASEILFSNALEFETTAGRVTSLSVKDSVPGAETVLDLLVSLHILESLGLFSTDQSSGTTTSIGSLISLLVSSAYGFDTSTSAPLTETDWATGWDSIQGVAATSFDQLGTTDELIDSTAYNEYLIETYQLRLETDLESAQTINDAEVAFNANAFDYTINLQTLLGPGNLTFGETRTTGEIPILAQNTLLTSNFINFELSDDGSGVIAAYDITQNSNTISGEVDNVNTLSEDEILSLYEDVIATIKEARLQSINASDLLTQTTLVDAQSISTTFPVTDYAGLDNVMDALILLHVYNTQGLLTSIVSGTPIDLPVYNIIESLVKSALELTINGEVSTQTSWTSTISPWLLSGSDLIQIDLFDLIDDFDESVHSKSIQFFEAGFNVLTRDVTTISTNADLASNGITIFSLSNAAPFFNSLGSHILDVDTVKALYEIMYDFFDETLNGPNGLIALVNQNNLMFSDYNDLELRFETPDTNLRFFDVFSGTIDLADVATLFIYLENIGFTSDEFNDIPIRELFDVVFSDNQLSGNGTQFVSDLDEAFANIPPPAEVNTYIFSEEPSPSLLSSYDLVDTFDLKLTTGEIISNSNVDRINFVEFSDRTDLLIGNDGDDFLVTGESIIDTTESGTPSQSIDADSGNVLVSRGEGAYVLAGQGNDTIVSGKGADIIDLSSGSAFDVVTTFNDSVNGNGTAYSVDANGADHGDLLNNESTFTSTTTDEFYDFGVEIESNGTALYDLASADTRASALNNNTGVDTVLYTLHSLSEEAYHSDLILYFNPTQDRIDLSQVFAELAEQGAALPNDLSTLVDLQNVTDILRNPGEFNSNGSTAIEETGTRVSIDLTGVTPQGGTFFVADLAGVSTGDLNLTSNFIFGD